MDCGMWSSHQRRQCEIRYLSDMLDSEQSFRCHLEVQRDRGWDNVVLETQSLLKFFGMLIQEIAFPMNFATQSLFGKYFK